MKYDKHYHFYTNGKDVVIAKTSFAGKTVSGVAKCDTSHDKFDFEAGKEIAYLRCVAKAEKKKLHHYIDKYTKNYVAMQDLLKERDILCNIIAETRGTITNTENRMDELNLKH